MFNNPSTLFEWGIAVLIAKGYSIEKAPEVLLSTPWSLVIRFTTETGNFYLKQTPPSPFLSNEPKIIQQLAPEFQESLPVIVAKKEDLHCFLMKDAGISLRESFKTEYRPERLGQAIKQYAAILSSTQDDIRLFMNLGVPDWRLERLPILFVKLIGEADFLKAEGLKEEEIIALRELRQHFADQCKLLASYGIPETLGYHDFHDKNVLIDPKTQKMTIVDWAETAIIHPFFSLHTALEQTIIHHQVKEGDEIYLQLQDSCLENWLDLAPKTELLQAFSLAKQVRLFWNVLASFEFMQGIDVAAFRAYYSNRSSPIVDGFRAMLVLFTTGHKGV